MYCQNCGQQNADTALYCNRCGSALRGQPVRTAAPVTKPSLQERGYSVPMILAAVVSAVCFLLLFLNWIQFDSSYILQASDSEAASAFEIGSALGYEAEDVQLGASVLIRVGVVFEAILLFAAINLIVMKKPDLARRFVVAASVLGCLLMIGVYAASGALCDAYSGYSRRLRYAVTTGFVFFAILTLANFTIAAFYLRSDDEKAVKSAKKAINVATAADFWDSI